MQADPREQKVEDLFHECLELEPERRAQFLAQACTSDPTLQQEVETLVLAFESAEISWSRRNSNLQT